MFEGKLIGIRVASEAKGDMREVDNIEALAGQGLAGDRYAELKGAFQRGRIEPSQEVTLIESEAIEAAARDYQLEINHATTRRNLLTSGVPLNHLVGVEFTVGDVVLRGVELCEPCGYLEKLTCAGIEDALRHRGGLRAQVVTGGLIDSGAPIRPFDH
jgi:MOSC domain-containing protein YiiM